MYSVEAVKGAMRVLEPNVSSGDRVSIIGSTDVDMKYYQAYLAAAEILDVKATLGLMTPRKAPGRPAPEELEAKATSADLAILTASHSLAHSETAMKVLRAQRKCITFPVPAGPRRAVEILIAQGVYSLDKIMEVREINERVARLLDEGSTVSVTSGLGTRLEVSIEGRLSHLWDGKVEEGKHYWSYSSWPPGDAHVSTIEDSAHGVVAIDGYISGLGMPSEPITLTFKDGVMVDIQGGPDVYKVKKIIDSSKGDAEIFCEVGLGTSPYQEIVNSNGDKYTLGTFHLALGNNASPCFGGLEPDGKAKSNLHMDLLLIDQVKVLIDKQVVVEKGKLNC